MARFDAAYQVYGMRQDWIKERIRTLKKSGKSQAGLAATLGVAPARVSEIIAGKRKIDLNEIVLIADYLDMSATEALACANGGPLTPVPLTHVKVIGAVQAGLFVDALEWPPSDWYEAPVGIIDRYAQVPQFGLEVRGPSMNELYPPGSVIVCVKLIDLGRDPKPGERVICQRRGDGDRYEATVKELRLHSDGTFWLWPRSNDPNFQQPWPLPKPGDPDHDGEEVTLAALVIGSFRPEA